MSSSCASLPAHSAGPYPSIAPPGCSDSAVPPRGGVADFPPVLAGRGRRRRGPALRRALRPPRRLLAAGLAVAAACASLTAARTEPSPPGAGAGDVPAGAAVERRDAPGGPAPQPGPGGRTVAAPVRIADAAAVELLRPGDRVDVIATRAVRAGGLADGAGEVSGARIVAGRALVKAVPRRPATDPSVGGPPERGGLIVLEVPRDTATDLAGAAAVSPLAVTLC
ncbi:hypothetical protein E4198_15705 [Streptomyces sp. RKND-216]|uniref:RcpC/CpaB family pilus assembly protein n=1 Tax=Streptomyces sp. RKND-216 TaxID=2562581 RepID=UPI00109E2CE3|nr:RcpC/CpaB family pilus assembly protein [Streptomyces sp. RKND-216]THA25949.1 hypothetical protein E4198_15705 [Streptomyces sp. RKND-216]